MGKKEIGIRWTIGDVSPEGFEALRLSIWGAHRAFGDSAAYAVCVNTIPVAVAKLRMGELPVECAWYAAKHVLPAPLAPFFDASMAEGAAWKLTPLQVFPDLHELSLDNDCILWEVPEAIRRWIADGDRSCVLAEDVRACFGRFAPQCGPSPRNAGIRGLPPGFDLARALVAVLSEHEGVLTSELDEQGLQVAAVSRERRPVVVPISDVTICSPFPPHLPHLGRCGAHFCGLNARDLGWNLDGRPASDYVREHWRARRSAIYERVGLPLSDARAPAARA